jgi:hypothetical protein
MVPGFEGIAESTARITAFPAPFLHIFFSEHTIIENHPEEDFVFGRHLTSLTDAILLA